MGEKTLIGWTRHTFNPWIGCTKVDELCALCYAETLDSQRFSMTLGGATKAAPIKHWGKGATRYRTAAANWKEPIKWNKKCQAEGIEETVFCASLADWLDDDGIPIWWLVDLLDLIRNTPCLVWLLLSKRPENFFPRMEEAYEHIRDSNIAGTTVKPLLEDWILKWLLGDAPKNVRLGTSIGNQKSCDERLEELLTLPAVGRFLSCEPLLGPVKLGLSGINHDLNTNGPAATKPAIHWVIIGCESGDKTKVRNWKDYHLHAADLIKQCEWSGTQCFHKQMPINGSVETDIVKFPPNLQVRQHPWQKLYGIK